MSLATALLPHLAWSFAHAIPDLGPSLTQKQGPSWNRGSPSHHERKQSKANTTYLVQARRKQTAKAKVCTEISDLPTIALPSFCTHMPIYLSIPFFPSFPVPIPRTVSSSSSSSSITLTLPYSHEVTNPATHLRSTYQTVLRTPTYPPQHNHQLTAHTPPPTRSLTCLRYIQHPPHTSLYLVRTHIYLHTSTHTNRPHAPPQQHLGDLRFDTLVRCSTICSSGTE